jgi:hypothetical protein
MKIKRFSLWVAVLIAAALTGLLLLWAGANRVQASPPRPRVSAVIVTDTDKMIWDAIGINPGDDMNPDVAYNSQDDEYLVVFEWEDSGGGGGRDLASIVVDSSGQTALSPHGVATSDLYTDTHPAVAYNPTNNTYLAVWERGGATGDQYICGVILNSSGAISGTEFIIAAWIGDQVYPDVAYSAIHDRYLVVWEDHYMSWPNRPDIYGALLSGSGSGVAWESITGLNAPGSQTRPAVAANVVNGRWLVAWADSRNSGTTGDDIYTQQVYSYSSGATMLWGGQAHIGDFWGAAMAPDVAWGQVGSGDGEFLTVWSENSLIYGQRVQANSVLAGDVISVSTNDAGDRNVPAVAFDSGDGAWWVAWRDSRDHHGPG